MNVATLRRTIAVSDHPIAGATRRLYKARRSAHLPLPRVLGKLLLAVYVAVRELYYLFVQFFLSGPLLRAACTRVGRNLRTGAFVPWIQGAGEIVLGDDVNVVGKIDIAFAARFSDRPSLRVGNRTGLGHGCVLSIAKAIVIGDDCHIAGGTHLFDSNGHPIDPELRRLGHPPADADVKPITIGNNVWIGSNCTIFPGVTIGDNSVVATRSVVTTDVPPDTLVAGYPARQIRKLV
ncbi:acyltransferase [Roseisolibacter sp. H3M3-2]|uniref:acyltransferase n=1 Tax=Roseisolibacter sp. H3M3-2 TaxID=3031323 RepID=UPI0023DA3A00|nr:acyltransferase [Roseisolibacter sp. H3M3-2]MDF1502863.1 acyltransferase [Roseisolibacter sp. H3M3-2]